MPAPIHSGRHALAPRPPGQRRLAGRVDHDRLVLAAAADRAAPRRRARHATATSPAQPGWPVIEFEARNTTPAPPAAAIGSRSPSTSATAPKKFTETTSAGSVPVNPPMPAAGHDAVHHVGERRARRRPRPRDRSAVDRSAVTSASRRSTVTTRWPWLAEQRGGGGADARGGSADDVGLHAQNFRLVRTAPSPARALGSGCAQREPDRPRRPSCADRAGRRRSRTSSTCSARRAW